MPRLFLAKIQSAKPELQRKVVGHASIQMRNANYELEEVKTVPSCHNISDDTDAGSFLVGFPERPQATRP